MVSLIRGNRGQSVVEFALVLPLLLMLLFGITELGRAIMTKNVLTSAAREGARLAIVSEPGSNEVTKRVEQVCRAAGIATPEVEVSPLDPVTGQIRVTVRSMFVIIPGTGIFNDAIPGRFTIGATAVMRHEAL